jgi:hypothetical protein
MHAPEESLEKGRQGSRNREEDRGRRGEEREEKGGEQGGEERGGATGGAGGGETERGSRRTATQAAKRPEVTSRPGNHGGSKTRESGRLLRTPRAERGGRLPRAARQRGRRRSGQPPGARCDRGKGVLLRGVAHLKRHAHLDAPPAMLHRCRRAIQGGGELRRHPRGEAAEAARGVVAGGPRAKLLPTKSRSRVHWLSGGSCQVSLPTAAGSSFRRTRKRRKGHGGCPSCPAAGRSGGPAQGRGRSNGEAERGEEAGRDKPGADGEAGEDGRRGRRPGGPCALGTALRKPVAWGGRVRPTQRRPRAGCTLSAAVLAVRGEIARLGRACRAGGERSVPVPRAEGGAGANGNLRSMMQRGQEARPI